MADSDVVRFLAAWALVHELADEGWKAAVERGAASGPGGEGGSGDMVDGISALISREKERLKSELAGMDSVAVLSPQQPGGVASDELTFELAEMRGRLETIETALDAIARRLDSMDGPR